MKGALTVIVVFFICAFTNAATPSHPRLYFNGEELRHLRELRNEPAHAKILKNIEESADWCLTKTPRKNWIPPVAPDPIYENLYDRFYAIMGDLAITEHLSFAYALTGKERYGQAAHDWALASCRVWQNEASGTPDSGKAYAVSRLLKGIAVAYDLAFDRFTEPERKQIRDTLERIGTLYYEKYFSTPTISGPSFHTHHAVVEWSSFGFVALTLLGETPQADKWLDTTVKKFEDHLLPTGLAPDGAQTEGATFWASTMHYRLFFMDPLRRVTGRDLFKKFGPQMNADLALASIASEHVHGYSQNNDDTVLEPYYGQLNYYSPILVLLAREYRRPIYQHLANWDYTLGALQKTRAIMPHGEQLLFALGCYAYVWYDTTVPDKTDSSSLSYHFKSISEAYLRNSWKPGEIVVGVSKDRIVIHAGSQPIIVMMTVDDKPAPEIQIKELKDSGDGATLHCLRGTNAFDLELNRKKHTLRVSRGGNDDWQWYCPHAPNKSNSTLKWKGAWLNVEQGTIGEIQPDAYKPPFATGFNKLKLNDPAPTKLSTVTLHPTNGVLNVTVRLR
jgi:hypothetical protein